MQLHNDFQPKLHRGGLPVFRLVDSLFTIIICSESTGQKTDNITSVHSATFNYGRNFQYISKNYEAFLPDK